MYQPLSRWKKIVIHDENNKITSIHFLDDNQRLINHTKKPKRKIYYRKTLENKFVEYVQSKDFLHRHRNNKSIMNSSFYLDKKICSQLDKLLKNVSKTKKCSGNNDSVLMKIEKDQETSLNNCDDGQNKNLEILTEKYLPKEKGENNQNNNNLSNTQGS